MTIAITHSFVSALADGADATVVRPSNWNAGLVTSMATNKLLGRATAATGVFEEITLGNLAFTGTTLNATTMTATVGGVVPTPPNNTTTFLRGDGTFAAPAAGSSTWDTIGAAAGSATTANGTNNIVYNTAPTADSKVAWTFGETSAATNGTSTSGVPNQVLLKLRTASGSTQSPLSVYVGDLHVFSVSPAARQILATNGTSANCAYSFASSVNTGLFWNGTNLLPTVGGVSYLYCNGSSITQNLPILAGGTAGSPFYQDDQGTNSGLFLGTNFMGVSTAGAENMRFTGGASAKQMLLAACTFANLGTPANGGFAYCSDCDAPTLVDSTCTSVGAKTGSFAARVNGAWKCFS